MSANLKTTGIFCALLFLFGGLTMISMNGDASVEDYSFYIVPVTETDHDEIVMGIDLEIVDMGNPINTYEPDQIISGEHEGKFLFDTSEIPWYLGDMTVEYRFSGHADFEMGVTVRELSNEFEARDDRIPQHWKTGGNTGKILIGVIEVKSKVDKEFSTDGQYIFTNEWNDGDDYDINDARTWIGIPTTGYTFLVRFKGKIDTTDYDAGGASPELYYTHSMYGFAFNYYYYLEDAGDGSVGTGYSFNLDKRDAPYEDSHRFTGETLSWEYDQTDVGTTTLVMGIDVQLEGPNIMYFYPVSDDEECEGGGQDLKLTTAAVKTAAIAAQGN